MRHVLHIETWNREGTSIVPPKQYARAYCECAWIGDEIEYDYTMSGNANEAVVRKAREQFFAHLENVRSPDF